MIALRVLFPFDSTYLCEAECFTLVSIKTRNRNRLDVRGDMRLALENTRQQISKLAAVVVDPHLHACLEVSFHTLK